MFHKSKIKLAALLVVSLSIISLLVHLYLANSSGGDLVYQKQLLDDIHPAEHKLQFRKLWGSVSSLEELQPHANPRKDYPAPSDMINGFIFAKIYGEFDKIHTSICDLVAVSRLLNATLIIPEIQESARSKGISSNFKSFSYLYNEEQFIAALANDVTVMSSLPKELKESRKKNELPTFKPKNSAPPSFYINEVLPKLKEAKAIGLIINDGGCFQSSLPQNMAEYQRLRCRVAFHALHFRAEIKALGRLIVQRLRASGRPYLAFHPGLVRDSLAFHGCAELFKDVHTELIQYRRFQMIKRGLLHEELNADSSIRRRNGSCPLMPEEVGLLLRAIGYPANTIIYLAGSEIFGGQRVLIPLRAMFSNLVDRSSLCSKRELSRLIGPEASLPSTPTWPPPMKSQKELIEEWKNAGPRPRPLPPPPARPFYQYEKEGWYGWITENDNEPDPSPMDLRVKAHRLLWDAVDYYVSIEADAFFPGFNHAGSGGHDFSGLVMGHRLYQTASSITYRPDRKTIVSLFDDIRDHLYHPKHNWTILVKEHLNRSLGVEGLIKESQMSKPTSFLSHPLPECTCTTIKSGAISSFFNLSTISLQSASLETCPEWVVRNLKPSSSNGYGANGENGTADDDLEVEDQIDFDEGGNPGPNGSSEQDIEMDPDD